MSRPWSLLTGIAALPVLAGFFGRWLPIGDSLAVFRLQMAVLLLLVACMALLRGSKLAGRAGLSISAVALLPLVWAYLGPVQTGGDLRLYQKNMLWRNDALAALEADIRASEPDVLTLQEVSTPNKALLAALTDTLPHQLWCSASGVGGTAIATRLTPVPGQEVCLKGMAAMKVQGPKGSLWLVSIHLSWPWPYPQGAHLATIYASLEEMEAPIVLAGDFNMVRWSDAMAAVRHVTGAVPAGPARGTYTGFAPWLVLPIDHVLAPQGGKVTVRPGLGSDHLGLLADLGL
jgi:endonuclease/exonuclease/phosphatase (EEP) superfamily protein YafD